jgi:hypothetical protein
VENHIVEYGRVVNKMINEHQGKENNLKLRIREVERDGMELNRRKNELKILKSKLVQIE